MNRMSGSEALVEALRREHVEVTFGHPGGENMPIYDAISEFNTSPNTGKGIRHILARHEQSAAHMADGYARIWEGWCVHGNIGPRSYQPIDWSCYSIHGLITSCSYHRSSANLRNRIRRVSGNRYSRDGYFSNEIYIPTTPQPETYPTR